jgi:hypothetical protein
LPQVAIGALCAAITLIAAPALAGSVYLNGVLVDGLTNQKFERVQSVRFDEAGNVYIDAPAYKVEVQQSGAPAPVQAAPAQMPAPQAAPLPAPVAQVPQTTVPVAPPMAAQVPIAAPAQIPVPVQVPQRILQRYWLVTQQNAPGMTQYDIDVYVNSQWVRRLGNDDEQTIAEVTHYLKPGPNKVILSAHKNVPGSRKSTSADQYFRVVIGTGNVGGDKVLIDSALVDFSRSAAQTDDVSQEFTINAQ